MKAKSAPKNVLVSVVMGSDSDLPIMTEATKILEEFGIAYELILTSAHRTPLRTTKFAAPRLRRGIKMIIVGAGAAAHLAGVIASQTTLPVIGIPINATSLNGLDALLSTVQMPGGIPVASHGHWQSRRQERRFICRAHSGHRRQRNQREAFRL
jgi:5-(carboxyamino)imidazole ribonucleotide mutase